MSFFESVRLALARHPVGVHVLSSSASERELLTAEARLSRRLPSPQYREFLLTWNGGSMFHESLVLLPAEQVRVVKEKWLEIGESSDGLLWLDAQGRVVVVDEEQPDPLLAGSDFATWLDVVMAREALLLDREGEFRDVFDEEEGVLRVEIRKKRALAGRKRDRLASLYPLELAELALEAGDDEQARTLLHEAVTSDPQAGPAWELLAALHRQAGDSEGAHDAYLRAAAATPSVSLRAMRLLEAAELSPHQAAVLVDAATAADPQLGTRLIAQVRTYLASQDVEESKRLLAKLQLIAAQKRLAATEHSEVERIERDLRARDALRVL
ncbi:MAG: hypothetical protein JNM83_25250 [Myxococcales bacterium]|nr:hypothetical protein [Myxococcales bacterium]